MKTHQRGKRVKTSCATCGNDFMAIAYRQKRGWEQCCSIACANRLRVATRWQRESNEVYRRQSSRSAFKESMRVKAGHRCQRCGKHQGELSRRLDVHRVIPQERGGEYSTDNVRVLCASCHVVEERWSVSVSPDPGQNRHTAINL